jgi:hypothetical protein
VRWLTSTPLRWTTRSGVEATQSQISESVRICV